jgi:pimeloyl-ACP methyl ester carboxylesterase
VTLELPHRYNFKGQSVAWGTIGAGKPLVLIHGTPFSSQVWRNIAPLLAKRWTLFYFDLLGYGESEKCSGQDVSLAVQNELLAAMFKEWSVSDPEALCHDFGGATALRGHYINGLTYARLTLIDPVAVAPWGSPFVQHVRKHEAAFSGLPAFAHHALLKAYIQGAVLQPLSDDVLKIYTDPWQGEDGQAAFYRQIAQMDQRYTDEIEPRYSAPKFPVQILWGADDAWIPLKHGQKFASLFAPGKLSVVPQSGHLMQEDAPEAIVAAMLS